MKTVSIVLLSLMFVSTAWAHGTKDPVKEWEKNRGRISTAQQSFDRLVSADERIDNLESQANYLQKNILILRNLMATDYPYVKGGMSKYKMDYIKALDDSLVEYRRSLIQMKVAMPD
jgi:hypothetical protein